MRSTSGRAWAVEEADERAHLAPYQVNEELGRRQVWRAQSSCIAFAARKETTDGVMESKQSHVFQQSRTHARAECDYGLLLGRRGQSADPGD